MSTDSRTNTTAYPPGCHEGRLTRDGGLAEIGGLLWRRKTGVFAGAVLGTLCGLLVAFLQPDIYQAKALIEIQDLNENFLNMREVSPMASAEGARFQEDLHTQMKILKSRSVLDAAAKSLLEQPAAAREPASRRGITYGFNNHDVPRPVTERQGLVRAASQNVLVRAPDGSRIVEVVCDSRDPSIAAGFTNALVDEYVDRSLRDRWESAHQTERWLNDQLRAARSALRTAENKLREYVQERGLVVTPEQHGIEEDRLRQFQQALSRAREERVVRQTRHDLAESRPPDTMSEILDDGALREYQIRLVDLRRQYAELSALYTDEHHQVKQVLAQIQALEPILERERANRILRIENEFEAARQRESLLAESYRDQKDRVLRQADVALEFSVLDRELETARQIYDTLLKRVKESGIASAMTASRARVVDRATAPTTPYKPNRVLILVMGLLTGGFVGIVFIFVSDQADRRLRKPGDAAAHLGLPELGIIRQSSRLGKAGLYSGSKLVLRVAWRQKPTPEAITPQSVKPVTPLPIELSAWRRKQSRWAESFRATRTSILFQDCGPEGLKSLVVTSPQPADGKTTVACNLAIAMAETGRRTLLVDADLRRPRMHELFSISNSRGLSDLLHSADPVTRLSLHGFLHDTSVPGLTVLPSGLLDAEDSVPFHTERTSELLRRLEREFAFVIVDTPPLLPVTDARVLARFASAAVVVLRLNESLRDDAQRAAHQLRSDGSRLLGAILNGWKPARSSPGYYGGLYESTPAPESAPKTTLAASA